MMTQIIEVLEDYRETLWENSGTSASAGYAVETAIEETRALLAEVEALRVQRDAMVKACEDTLAAFKENKADAETVEWVIGLLELTLGKDGNDDTH